jgi:hypothetical protein
VQSKLSIRKRKAIYFATHPGARIARNADDREAILLSIAAEAEKEDSIEAEAVE